MKRLFLTLLFATLFLAPCAKAASPTFSSFHTNDFIVLSNTAPWVIRSLGGGTNSFNTIYVTNLYATNFYTSNFFATTIVTSNLFTTNLVVSGFQTIITNTDATAFTTPIWTNALWVNATTSTSWVWDAANSVWVPINPAFASGLYAVPSVVELRAIGDNGNLVQARTWGNLAAGDGQGRTYWWAAACITNLYGASDDGISIIKPDGKLDSEPGRWKEE